MGLNSAVDRNMEWRLAVKLGVVGTFPEQACLVATRAS